ncbi:hypothetical protein [uncultured Gammaproteobacteria bacterium]|nr:hypothetical protein [uncultured Gammaproteobacteria bacterium]CAC9964975.1 hypothetical protein [uncultured Gammaproteobacteria bacterium]CAC9980951.1 hypothetical protein [uncultured Gammaproteobacteria bacterium]
MCSRYDYSSEAIERLKKHIYPYLLDLGEIMGTGYFFHIFFSCLCFPLVFKVDNKPYFCATVTTQFLLPIGVCLLTLFLILSNSF